MSSSNNTRNFCIIAHIDHGKSTLADRFLELTKTVALREMQEQLLDGMDLERERGITIKAHPVTLFYTASDGETYRLNLIDTPGHVDFTYEVSRSLSACEGALLVVDAAQGVQAQTLANVHLALDRGLTIIPVINKIDLPAADVPEAVRQLEEVVGFKEGESLPCSAKTGQGVRELLEAVVARIPPPPEPKDDLLRALVFDSHYDTYRGVLVYVRVMSGSIKANSTIRLMSNGKHFSVQDVGIFTPHERPVEELKVGDVGYLVASIRTSADVTIGDTITSHQRPATEPLSGFKKIQPVVFAGVYPVEGSDFERLRDALNKLQLNDSALQIEVETSQALGFGFRCGFLGLLHLEIVFERLQREYDMDVITTSPSVIYRILLGNGTVLDVDNPAKFPDPSQIEVIEEPFVTCHLLTPPEYLGAVMQLCLERRGICQKTDVLDAKRLLLTYSLPLAEIITDFADRLKSMTRGYGSFDYEPSDYQTSDIVKLEIRVNEEPVDAFSCLVHREKAEQRGRQLCERLKDVIPRHLFKVPIQAAIGGKIIARETIAALTKNVTAKCYGGDITRKRKLWEKQKEGKKRMKEFGKVSIPQSAFISVLKLDSE